MEKGVLKVICSDDIEMKSLKENPTKTKAKSRVRKRRRVTSGSSSEYEEMLAENALLMEKNLHASAVKNNLDETSVRKILKKVVTNDHVLALVKLREEAENSGPEEKGVQPKLTRAKVKELKKVSPKTKAPWNLENLELTPIKHIPVKTRPEVKALIAQELPDDEDDEEYEPTHDDVPSDDDQGLESCSDLDSQPRTPATPHSLSTSSPNVVKDGPFKVPQNVSTPTRRKLNLEEEATIALRTRSKLSLSSTSIEHIESTFIPPDDLPMPAVDDLWNQFLNECLNPASTSKHEDDDETDPEYNVAADPDANDEDEEALGNGIIKISKKELNDLVTELFNIIPEAGADDDLMADNLANSVLTDHSQTELSARWEGKQEPLSDEEKRENISDRIMFEKKSYTRPSVGKTEPPDSPRVEDRSKKSQEENRENRVSQTGKTPRVVDIAIEETETEGEAANIQRAPPLLQRHLMQARTQCVTIQVNDGPCILPEQIQILQQQLRQHIQLATSNYLQLYIHPIHWKMAPAYKEYLETLSKLCAANPKSVVNVCNLKPGLELMNTWETTVSANTPENKAMVEFIITEYEKCRRRFNNNNTYGEFHEIFKGTVATSRVFLYPYLLPPTPYRADHVKRSFYTRPEDELIALGLDQFWDYVEANPLIYKPRSHHKRQRWGLAITVQLLVKHMFPWVPCKVMLAHIQQVRKSTMDKGNPIYKFFENRTITPVKHVLLPFNPRLCLFEQPEHEVPKIWVRYLAKTSSRFKSCLYRRVKAPTFIPKGVAVELGKAVAEPTKAPLPIDFTKQISSYRINVLPKTTQLPISDNFDTQNICNPPINNSTLPTNFFKLVETSTGAILIPVHNITSTVNMNIAPISSPAEVVTEMSLESSNLQTLGNKEHCSCCVLLRKICKNRQTTITDYFKLSKVSKSCYCKDIKYCKVTNRLKILVSNFRSNSVNALQCLNTKLKRMKQKKCSTSINMYKDEDGIVTDNEFDLDDFAFVSSFHLKLLTRLTSARDTLSKRRVYRLISKFNLHTDDPITLTKALYEAFGNELVDMYKEFLCFLTPEQADKCEAFRDYFVRNCVDDLVKNVEMQVQNKELRLKILQKIHRVFYNNLMTACEICTEILSTLDGCPKLAQYVFSLFPHRKETRLQSKIVVHKSTSCEPAPSGAQTDDTVPSTTTEQPPVAMDYEADHSSSEEEENNDNNIEADDNNLNEGNDNNLNEGNDNNLNEGNDNNLNDDNDKQPAVIKTETTTDNEIQTMQINPTISSMQDSSDSSSNSMTIVFEEDIVKPEAVEWRRDEDKLILEVLKEHLTPEERKDKTIIEIIEEKNIIGMIVESLMDKSKDDVTDRVLYLLQVLVLSENKL